MLQATTLPKSSLELLKKLSPAFSKQGFYLAGGTALALRFGHRISVDLDFFTEQSFDPDSLLVLIEEMGGVGEVHIFQKTKGSLCLTVAETKIECFYYPYALLKPTEDVDGVTLASVIDNGVMKLSALTNRGSKKDFCDISIMLGVHSLSEWIGYYHKKFPQSDVFMLTKSLTWFDDAEEEPDPQFLNGQTWNEVKTRVSDAVAQLGV